MYDSFTGFFQRIEKLRKNAFGSMCVFGEDNNNSISGLWFWRGPQLAFEVCIFSLRYKDNLEASFFYDDSSFGNRDHSVQNLGCKRNFMKKTNNAKYCL